MFLQKHVASHIYRANLIPATYMYYIEQTPFQNVTARIILFESRFSSPEHNVLEVSFCDGPLSVVHRPCVRPSVRASTISLNNISSETTFWIFTKLHRNDPWVVPYQICSNRYSWLHKQVTRSINRFF